MYGVRQEVFSFDGMVPQELPGGQAALLYVARGTGGHKITQRMVALLHPGLNVIGSEFCLRKDLGAIDTAIAVPLEQGSPAPLATTNG